MNRRKQSGVTLVELLIAVALLGFILLGIAPLFIASVKSNYSANQYTSIHNLARDRLEQLMNLPFNDTQLQPGTYANDLPLLMPAPLPPTPSTVANPLTRTYEVHQYRITLGAGQYYLVVDSHGACGPYVINATGIPP